MKRFFLFLLIALLLGAGWILFRINDSPSFEPYAERVLPTRRGEGVRVNFLGVSTVVISDGETTLMTDGFFSRPPLTKVIFGQVEPRLTVIKHSLHKAGVKQLDAIFVLHSHYDHVMDAPEVAKRTGAQLIGSESTANVARGWKLDEGKIRVVRDTESMTFGGFTVTMIPSKHFPHGMAMGEIVAPLVPPAKSTDYKEGGSFSVLFEHEAGNLLIHASAGFIEGALSKYQADTVLLGIAGMGKREDEYLEAYFKHVVTAVGAKWVVPIHFDDFTRFFTSPPVFMPNLLDDVDHSLEFLIRKAEETPGQHVGFLEPWEPTLILRP